MHSIRYFACSAIFRVEKTRRGLLVEVARDPHGVVDVHEFRVRVLALGPERTEPREVS